MPPLHHVLSSRALRRCNGAGLFATSLLQSRHHAFHRSPVGDGSNSEECSADLGGRGEGEEEGAQFTIVVTMAVTRQRLSARKLREAHTTSGSHGTNNDEEREREGSIHGTTEFGTKLSRCKLDANRDDVILSRSRDKSLTEIR